MYKRYYGIYNKLKTFLAVKFTTLYYFYQHLGYRIFLLLLFSFLSVSMDGLGLTMFVPLLQISDGSATSEGVNDSLMTAITMFFNWLNLPVNTASILVLIGVVFVTKAFFVYFTLNYQNITLSKFVKKLRVNNSVGLSNLEYTTFVSADIGRLQNTLTGETNLVSAACSAYIESIKNGMIVLVYLTFAFIMDWNFSILVVIGGLLTNLIYQFFYKRTIRLSKQNNQYSHEYAGLVIQSVNQFKYLKATGRGFFFNQRLLSVLNKTIDNEILAGKIGATLTSMREPIMVLIVCVVIGVQVLFFNGPLAPIMIILVLFYRAMAYIMSLQSTWNSYLNNMGSMDNMIGFEQFLHQNKELKISDGSRISSIEEILISDLSFQYGDHKVLKGLNLSIKNKSSVAFVGESGSGKTTLINLICGLLKPSEGDILINGRSFGLLNIADYRSKIGYVSQEPTIFDGDIFDNITFWAERTQENVAKFYKIVEKCRLREFIEILPHKHNTLLGNNGLNLSGGQKQRISIGRELYREVSVLILDEATSALDSETEREIKDSVEALKGKVTIISIAHRLSTIKEADQIYVMKQGKIEEFGSFEELKESSMYFRRLTSLQGL